jgi:hypothetical protein
MNRLRALGFAFAMIALVAPAWADVQAVSTVLGQDGQLVTLLQADYAEIFPAGKESAADDTVLALRITQADGSQRLEPVPATLGAEREENPELGVESESGVTFVFWQSWVSQIHSRFLISSFDGTTWSEPIVVTGPAFSWRVSPAFAVTRDSYYQLVADGEEPAVVHRTVLHVAWLEEAEDGLWDTFYAPLVLENGEYVGNHPIIRLNELVEAEEGAAVVDLQVAPALRSGQPDNLVVAAFLDQRTGKVAAVELRFAAGELSLLGDELMNEIEQSHEVDADLLAAAVHARLMGYDDHLKPEILEPLASTVRDYLRSQLANGQDARKVGGGARVHLVDVGFRLTDGKMNRVTRRARVHLVDVGARSDKPRRRHRHDLRSSVTSSSPLPSGVDSIPEILVSASGTKKILAWSENDRIRYQESTSKSGWGPVQQVKLTGQLDAAAAMKVLQQRVDQR